MQDLQFRLLCDDHSFPEPDEDAEAMREALSPWTPPLPSASKGLQRRHVHSIPEVSSPEEEMHLTLPSWPHERERPLPQLTNEQEILKRTLKRESDVILWGIAIALAAAVVGLIGYLLAGCLAEVGGMRSQRGRAAASAARSE